jgi:hypothetical protein
MPEGEDETYYERGNVFMVPKKAFRPNLVVPVSHRANRVSHKVPDHAFPTRGM